MLFSQFAVFSWGVLGQQQQELQQSKQKQESSRAKKCQVMLSMACSYRVEGIVICALSIAHRMAQGPRQKGVRASDKGVLGFDTLRDSSTFASGQYRL